VTVERVAFKPHSRLKNMSSNALAAAAYWERDEGRRILACEAFADRPGFEATLTGIGRNEHFKSAIVARSSTGSRRESFFNQRLSGVTASEASFARL
jgi:hypothetical protein